MTFCFVVHGVNYLNSEGSNLQTLLSMKRQNYAYHPGLEINVQHDRLILKLFFLRDSRFEVKINLDQSNHVCFILSGKDVQAYVNGTKRANVCQPDLAKKCQTEAEWLEPPHGPENGPVFLVWGQRQNFFPAGDFLPIQSFAGKFGQMSFWNEALNAHQVATVYQNALNGQDDGKPSYGFSHLLTNASFWSGDIIVRDECL